MAAGLELLTSDDSFRTVVVPGLAPHTIPLAFFPDWKNDAGVPSFGGAQVVSINEDGVAEGSTTPHVTGVSQQPIAAVGGVTLPSPDPARLYVIRVRLRTAVGDVNFVDRVIRIRVLTPTMAPFSIVRFAANQEPDVTFDGLNWRFSATAGVFPAGEVRLRDGRGGILLPSAHTTPWPAAAQAYLLDQISRKIDSVFQVDFAGAGGVEAAMQVTYRVVYGPPTTVTRLRRRDVSQWGYVSSVDVDFVQAAVDMVAGTASVTFPRGLYSHGPRLESIFAVGSAGVVTVDPAQAILGATVDVSAAVRFDRKSHLSLSGLVDSHLLIVATVPGRIYMAEVPLRPTGWSDIVGADGVTNYFTARYSAPSPSQPLLHCRVLFGDYLEFPNLAMYYDPNTAILPAPTTLPYPRVTNIRIYAAGSAVASVVYADVLDLYAQLRTIRMPDVGYQRVVLDRRHLREDAGTPNTPIPMNCPYVRIVADVVASSGATPYEVEGQYRLNWDGQPEAWKIPAVVASPVAPTLTWNRDAFELTVVLPSGIPTANVVLRGDAGVIADLHAAVVLVSPGTKIVPAATMRTVLSRFGEAVELEYDVTGVGRFARRVFTTTPGTRMIEGSAANAIGVQFYGTCVVFTDVTAIAADVDGKKPVLLQGDGPPLLIPDVVANVPYFVNVQGASPLSSATGADHVDVLYTSGGPAVLHRLRCYSSFFDRRAGSSRTLAFVTPAAHGATGAEAENFEFDAPRSRTWPTTQEIEFEDDDRVYDFAAWTIENLHTGEAVRFTGRPTGGKRYRIGSVLTGTSAGQQLLLSVLHRSGSQRVFKLRIGELSVFQSSVPVSLRAAM